MIALLRICSLILLVGLATCSPPKEPERVLVRTRSGPVAGIVGKDIFVFKGIPYAAAPWTENRDGKAFGPDCGDTPDCLTLNVWAPPGQTRAPIIVSERGNAADIDKVAATHVKRGQVFVSINTRSLSRQADEQAAVNWISANIAEFGGDPHHMTDE
jgi:para-nitrobenzyl esterase